MRILVTGGAGFIGSHLVDLALEAGHELVVLDDLSSGRRENLPPSVPLHVLDLRNRDGVLRLVSDVRPHAVAHLAAQASVSVSMREPLRDAEINIIGSIHLLDACARCSPERFVFASTGGAIYGEVTEGTVAAEDAPRLPRSPYAISKLCVEQLLEVYRSQHGFDGVVLRYANVYGPRQDPFGEAGVVAIFARALAEGRALAIHARRHLGDEGCVRDYVYVRDVARLSLLALEGRLSLPTVNVATGVATSTRELAQALFRTSGQRTEIEPRAPRPGDLQRSVLDPTVCRRALGELTALGDGLAQTWRSTRESSLPG